MIKIDNGYNFFLNESTENTRKRNYEKFVSLTEDMFTGGKNSPQLRQIDSYFDEIVDLIDEEHGLSKDKGKVNQLLRKIKTICDKMFNIDLDIQVEYNRPEMQNLAYTYFNEDTIELINSEIKHIVINKETGYHMINRRYVNMFFENQGLRYLKFLNLSQVKSNSNKDIPDLVDLNGRHLTSILLHELGHHVFFPFYFDQKNDGSYEIQIGDQEPFIVHEDEFNFEGINTTISVLALIASMVSLSMGFLTFGIATSILSRIISGKINFDNYMRNEKNANTLSFQYGYIEELFDDTIRIKWIQDGTKLFNIKDRFRKIFKRGGNEYQSVITADLLKLLDKELQNSNNTKEQIRYLEKMKEKYLENTKNLQAEIAVFADEKKLLTEEEK